MTGHLLTIPNEKVVNSSVENIGSRPHIRWLTNITITTTHRRKKRRFNDAGIAFAFPSRTLFLAKDDERQLKLKMPAGESLSYTP